MKRLKGFEDIESKAGGATDVTGPVQNQINWLQKIMLALVVVLFLGFSGMFVAVGQMMIDSLRGKQATYTELQKTVEAQDDKMDILTDNLNELTKALQESQTKTAN